MVFRVVLISNDFAALLSQLVYDRGKGQLLEARCSMKIRHLTIKNFRGIRAFDWNVPETPIICLIGPGDSMKSTILDAIECALSPQWNIQIADSDFYRCQTKEPIEINVTVGQFPEKLEDEIGKFGLHLRGWSQEGGVVDEPGDDTELVLTVRFRVSESLEPSWVVYTDRRSETEHPRINARDRESLGAARLGQYIDRHLSWGRGSALLRLTGDLEDIAAALAQANREIREKLAISELPTLNNAAQNAQAIAGRYGVNPVTGSYRPALDPQSGNIGIGLLALHDGDIPVRQAGLGSRRLLTLALQRAGVREGAILLIDEIEAGLEPYRLRHLIRELRSSVLGEGSSGSQVFTTTHSPVVISEAHCNELYIVRSANGDISIQPIEEDVYRVVQHASEALLARKLLLCEGKTELGMSIALDLAWANQSNGQPFGCLGVVPVLHPEGGGGAMPSLAEKLAILGYDVIYWGEVDRPISPSPSEMETAGVKVVVWADQCSTEERVCNDLPWDCLQEFVDIALADRVREDVFLYTMTEILGRQIPSVYVSEWLEMGIGQLGIRRALGKAAKERKWFKTVELGQRLGELVAASLPNIGDTDLGIKLRIVRDWAYG